MDESSEFSNSSASNPEQLSATARELNRILDNLQDVYYRTDAEGHVLRLSASARDVLGYEAAELIGAQLASLYYEPDGRARFLQALQASGGGIRAIGRTRTSHHSGGLNSD